MRVHRQRPHILLRMCTRLRKLVAAKIGGKLTAEAEIWTMSLLQLGPVLFGGTDGIITYLQNHALLARSQNCIR